MMLGFADVPIEISRARKPRTIKVASARKGASSGANDGAGGHQSSQPSSHVPALPAPESNHYSPTSERECNRSAAHLHGSNSPGDADSSTLYAQSTCSREAEEMQPSSSTFNVSATSSSNAGGKRDNRILQTSNGVVLGTSKAIGKILVAGLKSPFEVSLSAAKGFHNVPRLYGDETVRPHDRITGVWSGLKAAGKVSLLLFRRYFNNTMQGLDLGRV